MGSTCDTLQHLQGTGIYETWGLYISVNDLPSPSIDPNTHSILRKFAKKTRNTYAIVFIYIHVQNRTVCRKNGVMSYEEVHED